MESIRVFISSPSDVAEERFIARGVAERLQGEFSGRLKLETFFWEHEPLLATDDFQTQIESPADYDIFVSILWARIGSPLPGSFIRPDGTRYESGTEYEYEAALTAHANTGKPEILVYRKTAQTVATLDDEDQLLAQLEQKRALDRFIERWFINTDRTAKGAFHTFDKSEDFETVFEVHLRKLIGQHLGDSAGAPVGAAATWIGRSPFRGLNVFEFEHSEVFFGRTRATVDILDALRHQAERGRAFVLVLGMSGGGKSSLARAGVVPMLTRTGVIKGVRDWRRGVFSPAESHVEPIVGLVRAMIQDGALPELLEVASETELAELMRSKPDNVGVLMQRVFPQGGARLVIVVDQLEEIFTHAFIDQSERLAFVRALSSLAATGSVWIIATMRSDFYPRCEELPELMALKEDRGQYDLAPPTATEIGQMIRFPARAAGLRFEEDPDTGERLDDVLRDQASANPEMLPLLEFTLEELYQRRTSDGLLTFAAYDEIGGVEGSIARRAEHVYESLPPDVQEELDHTLDRLVTRSMSDRDAATRLRARLDELSARAQTLVDAFVEARLFVTELDEQEMRVGRIAHEALIKRWPRIQLWLKDNEENLRLHARLADAETRWRAEPTADLLLPAGKPLDEALMLEARGFEVTPGEHEFVTLSKQRVGRNRVVRQAVMIVLVFLTIGTALAAGVALQQSQRAKVEAQTAEATTGFLVGLFEVSDPWSVSGVMGSDITAREILDRGAEDAVTELADQPRVQANFMNAIGNVYQGLGLLTEAEEMLQQALQNRLELFGANSPQVADTLHGLGFVAYSNGEFAQAEAYLKRAIDIRQSEFGRDALQVFYPMNLMSIAVANQDRLDEAIQIQTEAIRILNYHENVSYVDSSFAYNNLGYVMNSADRFEEAADAFRRAVELTENTDAIGLQSRALSNLAAAYQQRGRLEEARTLHERALALKREWFEAGHTEIAYSLNNLAAVTQDLGEYEYAIQRYEEAIEIFRNALGEQHPNVSAVRGNLAVVYQGLGDQEEAIALYEQSLAVIEASGGAHSSRTLSIQIGLGRAYRDVGNMDAALRHLEAAVETGRTINPAGHRTGLAMSALASLTSSGMSYVEREEMFEQALVIVTEAVGESDPNRAGVLIEFARFLYETGQPERARSLFAEGLAIRSDIMGDEHPSLSGIEAEFQQKFGE